MEKAGRALLTWAVFLCRALGQAQTTTPEGGVRVWQDSLQLPTYPENDAESVPQFAVFGADHPNYPYPERGSSNGKIETGQAWRTLNLENEYLFCRVMPDLGGHLYSCRDKRNGREMFYANPVVKKDVVGLRGAWVAMGVESNFPVAHSRDSASPVDFAIQKDAEGSGRVIVEDLDRVTGMEWRVEFILRPGSTALEQRVTLANHTPVRHPYDWWANAEVAFDDPGTRVIFPAYLVASHGASSVRPWPTSSGVDDSLVAGHKDSVAWFAYGSREPFMAVYKPASRSGVAHYADPEVVQGKKLWYWGSTEDDYVKKNLTNAFSSYVEIQGGLFQDQETYQFLGPEETKSFSEFWMPIDDLGGVSEVTSDAIANLQRTPDGSVRIEISPVHAIPGIRIRLMGGAATLFETRADLDPAKTYSHTVPNPGPGQLTLDVIDSRGAALLEYTEGRYAARSAGEAKIGQQPPRDWSHTLETSEFLSARAEFNESNSRSMSALLDYRNGLSLFPSSPQLQKGAARLALELDRASEAESLLAKFLKADPSDEEAIYLMGVAESMLGKDSEARLDLLRIPVRGRFFPAALLQLCYLSARSKDYSRAAFLLQPLLAGDVHADALEVALLRRAGRTEEARKKLAQWRATDPADTMLRIEATLLGADDADLWMHLAQDAERILNSADQYLKLGMLEDALTLLAHPYPAIPKEQLEPGAVPAAASPLLAYYRAYCRRRLGQDPGADLRQASSLPARYIFPFRASSYDALTAAIAANHSDATAHFLLGRLLLYRIEPNDAINEWREAQALKPVPAELNRDLNALLDGMKSPSSVLATLTGRAGADLTMLLPPPVQPNTAEARNPAPKSPPKKLAAATRPAAAGADAVTAPREQPPGNTPLEIASAALLQAGAGQPGTAAHMFDPKVFTAEKQPDEVRRAYIEVQLQGLLAEARSTPSVTVLTKLEKLGAEDKNLPFTFYGFFSFMTGPHFEYFSSLVEAACHDEKGSRKHWAKISRMSAPLESPEFVYPSLAAARLDPTESKPRIAAALASIRGALGKAPADSHPSLQFSEAMLLHAGGDDSQAVGELQKLVRETADTWVKYLAIAGLREVLDGKQ